MTIYVVCMFFILFQEIFSRSTSKIKIIIIKTVEAEGAIEVNQLLFIIDALLLIMLAAFRNNTVGTDTRAYFHWIEMLPNYSVGELFKWSNDSGIEIGYAFVSKLFYSVFGSREIVLIVINGILFWGIYKFAKKSSDNIILSIYLFLTFSMFNQSLNINGQYVAAVFLMLSIEKAHKKEIKLYILYLLLAIAFHISAVIGLIFLPIALFENKAVRNSIIIVIVAFAGSLFATKVINAIVSKTIYSIYLYKEVASESGMGIVINALIFLVFLVFYKQFREHDEYAPVWLYATAITLGLNFYIRDLAMIGRLMVYFKLTYIISIPNFIGSFADKKMRMLISAIIVVIFGFYYWHSINGACYGTIPYISDALGITG